MTGILAGLLLGSGIVYSLFYREYAEGVCLTLAGLFFCGLIFITNGGLK